MARIVTFDLDGVSKVSDYSGDTKSNQEIKELLHRSDVRIQMAEFIRSATKNDITNVSNITLGYELELLKEKRFFSRITNIQFHPQNMDIRNFGVKQQS